VRRHHTRRALSGFGATIVVVLVLVACTPTTTTTPPPTDTGRPPLNTVTFAGITFDVRCAPVAEALVDIPLPHRGQPKLRAITGLWDHQAVAVFARDRMGCGLWTLAIATGLTEATTSRIEAETARGVQIFGVTASPVPRDEGP
jgi:hypothetical protein